MSEKSDTQKTAEAAVVPMMTVDYDGVGYSLPKEVQDRPLLFSELLAQNRITDALGELLGKDQASAFLAKHRTWREFNAFFDAIQAATGGNS